MPADAPTPLATPEQMRRGAFADLVRAFSDEALTDLMVESTRMCEGVAARRLAPFADLTESHRAEGIDPDEYTDGANLPLDLQGTLGRSYAYALGASTLVRHMWLNEYAVRHPELWTYSDLAVTVVRSYGGTQPISPTQILAAESDTGHIFFQLGLFIPIGSVLQVKYSGGYTTAIPADLVRAGKFMAACLALEELGPGVKKAHDPEQLRDDAEKILTDGYMRT